MIYSEITTTSPTPTTKTYNASTVKSSFEEVIPKVKKPKMYPHVVKVYHGNNIKHLRWKCTGQ